MSDDQSVLDRDISHANLHRYAHGINIPDSVYKHKSFKELRRICSDVIIL